MSYVRETLAPNEEILAMARFNWTYYIGTVFWLVVSALPLGAALVLPALGQAPDVAQWVVIGGYVSLALGFLLFAGHLIHVRTTEIAVTSTRFVFKTGLISRMTKEVSLNKIEEIQLSQSVFGRILGYGSLILRGTGVGVIELPDIDNPIELRRAIEGAKDRLRGRSDGEYAAAPFESALAPRPVRAKRDRHLKRGTRRGGRPSAPAAPTDQRLR